MNFIKETDLEETSIGKIPKEWKVTSLKAVSEIRSNKGINGADKIAFIPMELVPDSEPFVKYQLRKRDEIHSFTYCQAGDLLLAKITPSLENGKQGIVPLGVPNGVALATTEVFPIHTNTSSIDTLFLFYVLKHTKFRNKIISSMIGTTGRQRASKESVERLEIPLPTTEEQKAIANVLSDVDSALELADSVIVKTERLKKGLMQHLLTCGIGHTETKQTPIGKMPSDWEITTIGSVLTLQRGHDLPLSKRQSGAIPVIGSNGVAGYHNKCMAAGPGVTIGRSGSIGKAFYVEEDYWPLNTSLYVKEFKNIYPKYAYYLFEKMDLTSRMHSGTAVPTLNRNNVHPITVAIPSTIAEQKKIAEILTLTNKKIELEESEKKKLEKVKQGLMDLLLTGKVRVKEAS